MAYIPRYRRVNIEKHQRPITRKSEQALLCDCYRRIKVLTVCFLVHEFLLLDHAHYRLGRGKKNGTEENKN